MSDVRELPPVFADDPVFRPNEIILYGKKLNTIKGAAGLPIALISPGEESWKVGLLSVRQTEAYQESKRAKISFEDFVKDLVEWHQSLIIAAIYAYAFEGKIYRLDKPRVLSFFSQTTKQADGALREMGYSMWRVTTSDNVVEMTVSADTFQKLILDQNLPGRRSPNTYASNMISGGGGVTHRGGRLMEP